MRKEFLVLVILILLASGANASWWNNTWQKRIPITLSTNALISENVERDLVLSIDLNSEQTDFWASIQNDGDDVRFVGADDQTDLNFHEEGFNFSDQDANYWVEVTDTFPADSNLTIYVYYGNAGATSIQNENNTYPDGYTAVYHMNDNNTAGQTNSTEDGNFMVHTNTPTVATDGMKSFGVQYKKASTEKSNVDGLLDETYTKLSFMFWIMKDGGWSSEETENQTPIIKVNNPGADFFDFEWTTNGTLRLTAECDNGTPDNIISSRTVWNAGEWYHITAIIDTDSDDMNFYVNGSTTDGGTENGMTWGACQAGTFSDLIVANSTGVQYSNQHFDELKIFFGTALTEGEVVLMYNSENDNLAFFQEPQTLAPELTITTINGVAFSTSPVFAFGIDGNITVDFNIFQEGNNRVTLDLNYSSDGNTDQGNGVVIVEDLNLDSDICSDQDWNDFPSECSVSWNFSTVADNNYFISGLVSDGNLTDFNSDGNFAIQNDVNLVVLIPINEETGAVIDTFESAFIVRINANDVLTVFNNQLDTNGFLITMTSDTILVEIDTNTPALFDSRVYSFSFTEAIETETLQPFLSPVSASILTTVKVLEFENLNPIPDVQLRVFKVLAEGRTLIHDSITDGKGESTIPFIVADLYEIDVLVDGVLIFTENYIATATTSEHFIFIASTEEVDIPDALTTPTVNFTPAQKHFNTFDVNLGVIVSTELSNIAAIHFFITNADFNIFDGGLDTGDVSDGNTYSVNINNLQEISDTNFPFVSTVIVFLDDGNSFVYSASYSIRPGGDEVLNLLMYSMREEFSCNTDDLSVRCDGLMFIAFFIVLFVMCAFAAGARGILGGEGLVILGLVLFGFFTFIAWVPLWLFIVMIFAAMGVILTRTRFLGA